MKLLRMLLWDVRLQARHNIYTATIVSTLMIMAFLWMLPIKPMPIELSALFIFLDPALMGLSFVGAIVLSEKSTKVLSALNVTPSPDWVYVLSKVTTLSVVGIIAGLVISYVATASFHWGLMILTMILSNVVAVLVGFGFVARAESMNALMISLLYASTLLFIPFLAIFGVVPEWSHWLIAIIPSYAVLLSIQGAIDPAFLSSGEWVYAIVYQLVWIVGAWKWSMREYVDYIVFDGR